MGADREDVWDNHASVDLAAHQPQNAISGVQWSQHTKTFKEQWIICNVFQNYRISLEEILPSIRDNELLLWPVKLLKFQDESNFHCGFALLPSLTTFDI